MAKREYIHNDIYNERALSEKILAFEFDVHAHTVKSKFELHEQYESSVYSHDCLTKEAEIALFHQMNCAKYLKSLNPTIRQCETDKTITELDEIVVKSRNTLLLHNLRLIPFVIGHYELPEINSDLAISEGSIILLKAIDAYNIGHSNGNGGTIKFSTYATCALYRELFSLRNQLYRDNCSLNDHHSLEPDSEFFSYSKSDFDTLTEEDEERLDIIIPLLFKLPENEFEVLVRRYGLYGNKVHSLTELGEIYNCSYEAIRKRQIRAIRFLTIEYNKQIIS